MVDAGEPCTFPGDWGQLDVSQALMEFVLYALRGRRAFISGAAVLSKALSK